MDDLREKMDEAGRLREQMKANSRKQFSEVSRRRLTENARKKLQTTFVGAVAQIEKAFGVLWRNKKAGERMTLDEQHWYDKYQEARNAIFTNGNNQIRALEKELETYSVRWDGYQTRFVKEQQ